MSHLLDPVESLTLVRSYDIEVARTQYMDSAENTLVFANRRPIVLCGVAADGRSPDSSRSEGPLHDDGAVRGAYRRLTERHGSRVLAQVATEPGSEVEIDGATEHRGKMLRFKAGAHHSEHACPLTEAAAEEMLAGDHATRGLASGEKPKRTLAHLLLKVSTMFCESGIESFTLVVRVHDNGYKVVGASVRTELTPHVRSRLASNAHDRKMYDYHPSGLQ